MSHATRGLALLFGAAALAAPASAQLDTPPGPELGDPFIFFAEGLNLDIERFGGAIVDTVAGADRVMAFDYRDFGQVPVAFNERIGRDASANVAQGDVLSMRLWSSPDNAGKTTILNGNYSSVQIRLVDSFQPTNEADVEPGAPLKDFGFRLSWVIPEDFHDGQWRDVQIPFPPATYAELEAARPGYVASGDLRQYWYYEGARVANGVGVGPAFGGSDADPLFREFDFENLAGVYVAFDNNDGGGAIYLDDLYIGDTDADLAAAQQAPGAVTGVSFQTVAGENVVSIAPDAQFGRYLVYGSDEPITDLTADNVYLLTQIDAGADAFEFTQDIYSPYPTFQPITTYYAVTGQSAFGVPNETLTGANSGAVVNRGEEQGFIYEFTADQAAEVFDDIDEGIIDLGPWRAIEEGVLPFEISIASGRVKTTNNYATIREDDDDLSGKLWMAYDADGFVYYYAEVRDDLIFPAAADEVAALQNRESVEVTLGLYDQSSIVFGTEFRGQPIRRGETPDFQFRFTPRANPDGSPANVDNWVRRGPLGEGPGALQIANSLGAWEYIQENGANVGYRMTGTFDMADVYDPIDAVYAFPSGDEVRIAPFGWYLNDRDTPDGNRDHQISWSTGYNSGSGFFNQSAQWATTAIVGQDAIVNVDSEEPATETASFVLYPARPNPVASARATLAFDLAQAGAVTLEVFDTLGRRVAVAAEREAMAAGPHTREVDLAGLAPGVYLYRLVAGTQVATRTLTVVR